MSVTTRIVNTTGLPIQIAHSDTGFKKSSLKSLIPGEAFVAKKKEAAKYIARDSHSRNKLNIEKVAQPSADYYIVEQGLKAASDSSEVLLNIQNNTAAAIEVFAVSAIDKNSTVAPLSIAKLTPKSSKAVIANANSIYVACIYTSGTHLQTFATNSEQEQTFDIRLKSSISHLSAKLSIDNRSSLPLVLQWVDLDGSLKRTTALKPNESRTLDTYLSHQWILRDAHSGLPLDVKVISQTSEGWSFDGTGLRSISVSKPTVIEFWNSAAYPITLIWRDNEGQEIVADTLLPGARRVQPSKAGHIWEMQNSSNQQHIQTFVAAAVPQQLCRIIPRNDELQLPPTITFDNNAGLTVELLAKDEKGIQRVYATLPPNTEHQQPLTSAKRWAVRDINSGQIIEYIDSSNESFTHRITANGIHSQLDSVPVEAEFVNTTPFTVDISWIDYDGEETHFHRLEPGQNLFQATHATQVWRVRERETREILHLFVATEDAKQQFEISLRPIYSRESAVLRFSNYTGLTIEVVWFDADGKAKVLRSLIPGRKAAFNTFASHAWILRDKASGTVLKTVVAKAGNQQVELNNSNIRSKRSDRGTRLTFKNKMPFKVDVHWVGYDGKEVFHETLRSGDNVVKDSYTTHPYRFRHHISKREVATFLPTEAARQDVDIELRAYENRRKTVVEVRNMTTLTTQVFAVDYFGNEHLYSELEARESLKINTFSTHPIIVRDKLSQEPIAFTIAGDKPQRLEVSPDTLRSNRTEYPVWIKWVNTLKLAVDIFWVKYDGSEELMRTLAAGESFDISSYPTHVWRARFKKSGTTVDTYITGKQDRQQRNIGSVPPLRTSERAGGVLWPGEVALYEKPNYEGRVWIAHGDLPDFAILSGFDNRISSLRVAPNTAASVFEDSHFNALSRELSPLAENVGKEVKRVNAAMLDKLAINIEEHAAGFLINPDHKKFLDLVDMEQILLEMVNVFKSSANQFPKQLGEFLKKYIADPHSNLELSQVTLNFKDTSELDEYLKTVLKSRPDIASPKVLSVAANKALQKARAALSDAFSRQIDSELSAKKAAAIKKSTDKIILEQLAKNTDILNAMGGGSMDASDIEGIRNQLTTNVNAIIDSYKEQMNNVLILAAEQSYLSIKPLIEFMQSDVFHVDAPDLENTDIGNAAMSSIRILRNVAPETLHISSTNKLADDPQIKDGQVTRNPVYRTTIKFPPEVKEVQLWGTEEMQITIGDAIYDIGPKDDQFARIKPNIGGSLVIQVKPDKIGVPPIMLRTNSMVANARVFIFPDADIHRKFVKLDEDAFVKGIPDKEAKNGKRTLETKDGASEKDIKAAQKAIQALSKTAAAAKINNATGSAADRRLVVGMMDMSAFQLDFGAENQAADSAFRPIDPAILHAQAVNAEEIGQGFIDFLEDVGEGIVSIGVGAVELVEDGGEWLGGAFEDAGEWFEDAGNFVAEGFEDLGESIGQGLADIGAAFEDAGEWLGDRLEDGIEFMEDVIEDAGEFLEDIGEAISDGLEMIGEGIVKGLQIVITAGSKVFKVLVDTIEKVGEIVMVVVTKIVEVVEKVVDFLCSLFAWGDILDMHDSLEALADSSFAKADKAVADFQVKSADFFDTAREEVAKMMSSARSSLGVEDLKKKNNEVDSSDGMDMLMWIFDKLTAAAGGAAQLAGKAMDAAGISPPSFGPKINIPAGLKDELDELGSIVIDLASGVIDEGLETMMDAFDSIITRLGDAIKTPSRAPQLIAAMMLDIGELLIDASLLIAAEIADAFLRLLRLFLRVVQLLINHNIEIPFITELYFVITRGRSLTIKSIACLLLAIPVTIVGKLVFGNSEFLNVNLAQDKKTLTFVYGFSHILIGLIDGVRDALRVGTSVLEKDIKSDFDPYAGVADFLMTFEAVLFGISAILNFSAIGASGPYGQSTVLSRNAWGFQFPAALLDVASETFGIIRFKKGVDGKAFRAVQAGTSVLTSAFAVAHLTLSVDLFYTEDGLDENGNLKSDEETVTLGISHHVTAIPAFLEALFLSKNVYAGGFATAGRAILHLVEGGAMIRHAVIMK